MNDLTLLIILLAGAVVAFGIGIWVGLGYPGLYEKYESTGRAPRESPFQMLVDWVYGKFGR
jgi:hypothetical protein